MISIVIPTYNRAKFLPRAIRSVQNQTYENWELIIVDDGSSDNTDEVVQNFLNDERIFYIKKKNSGATHTRNIGAENSTFEFITFLDSDDEAKTTWLSSFYGEILKGAEVVCCGFEYYDHSGLLISEHLPKRMGELYFNRRGKFSNGGVFILKKYLFSQIGGYDDKLMSGQHSEMAIRLFKILQENDIRIHNLFVSLIKVYVHKEAKIRTDNNALYEGTIYVLKKHQNLFEQNKTIYSDYLGVAAVSAIRLNKVKEGKKLLIKAFTIKPFLLKPFLRLLIGYIPFLRNKYWGDFKK